MDITQVTNWLIQYQYWILFPIVVIEGPVATVIAGFVLASGYMNFFMAYVVVMAGDVAGDIIYYLLGRFGGIRFIEKWGRYMGLHSELLAHLEKHFDKHGSKTLFVGKMAHGIGAVFLVAAGLVRMPFQQFVAANFFATLLKSLALLAVGFYFGQALAKINSILEFIGALSISVGIIILLVWITRYYNAQESKEHE